MIEQMAGRDAAMRRWMIVVGSFYLVLGVRLLPFVNGPMIEAIGVDAIYLGGDLDPGTPVFDLVLDWMGSFGLTLLPMGAVLLVASKAPLQHRLLVHLVILHELAAGVVADAMLIMRGNVSVAFYLGFIVVHTVVIATGVWVLRRTPAPATGVAAADSSVPAPAA